MSEVKAKRILVPVEGAHTDEESLRIACTQAKRDRAEIIVLYVIEVRPALAIDADVGAELERGERVLQELQQRARQWGCRVQTDLLQAREAGSAIVNEAVERQIDMIAMGVPYKEKFGEFKVEPRALYVLDHARCRVCLVREPFKNMATR